MREGYYVVRYQTPGDWGMGMLVLDTGVVTGVDIAGAKIDGAYAYNQRTDMIDIDVVWEATQTTTLVQGQTVPAGFSFPIRISVSNKIKEKASGDISTPMGSLKLEIWKVRDFT